jgi:hypothetical protein
MHTFGEQAILASLGVLPQEPAIAEVVITLNELNAIPASQAKLVRTSSYKLVCNSMLVGDSVRI